ncbi:MerR family transcriptional regulator [Dactylosporangium sp. AC04546]|uniref:MerR family transcriptional regulator n=1 Tax=Dactylosporangium sp. AC04546 TaxID=2862460 RepID=UPI001EDE3121|nr:MerR family transcriptional regulator [Dactylosporangium sp. AC04546]WVK86468.1 MerR family transcriptional regulator [Dactylosporangium sp. AC04546]
MRIGALARAVGTTTRTLRYYEQEGLLTSARTAAGYRDYAPATVRRVRNVRELLALGFTIADVREFRPWLDQELPPTFVAGPGCAAAMRVAEERLALIRQRLDTLTQLHDSLMAPRPSGAGPHGLTGRGRRSGPATSAAVSATAARAGAGSRGGGRGRPSTPARRAVAARGR